MSVRLTEGAIEALSRGKDQETCPVLQVMNIRRIEGGAGPPRFRLMMSDGLHSLTSFMLATQLNGLVDKEKIMEPLCVCLLNRHVTSTLQDGRRVVILLEVEVVRRAEEVGRKIGSPTPYIDGQSPTTSPQKTTQKFPSPAPSPSKTFSTGQSPTTSPQKTAQKFPSPAPSFSKTFSTGAPWTAKGSGRSFIPLKKATAVVPRNAPAGSLVKVVPIASLNPYQNKWTIRAQLSTMSSVRTWSNSKGEGKLFSFEVVDESGDIRITAFNKEVDRFFTLLEPGKVYYISKGTLKMANKQFCTLKNPYEISLHGDTSIVPCHDDGPDLPTMHCDFVPIAELENRDKDNFVDVIGVCRSVEEVSRITTRSSREVSKRVVHLLDTSNKEVALTLWGKEAERFHVSGSSVLAVRRAKVSDFGGRSLSVLSNSTLLVNPDIPQAFLLRGWYDQKGHALNSQSLTEKRFSVGGANTVWKTLSDVQNEELGNKEEYFSCVATVLYSRKESSLYRACPSAHCFKKVLEQQDGLYRCERCDRQTAHFNYRFILSVNIADYGANLWVTCFQETAPTLLGQSADALGRLRETDEDAFDEVFQQANFKTLVFRNRIKLETYNEESRLKATVMDIKPVDHREYSRRLINNIRKMAA